MKTSMTYNEIYFILSLINDMSGLKLKAKAMTEKLLLRAHYLKPVHEYEEFKKSVDEDETADEEAKAKAKTEKAQEVVEGFTPRYLSEAAFEQIVEAMPEDGMITSQLAAPVTDENGNATALGKLPVEFWLQAVAENVVGI